MRFLLLTPPATCKCIPSGRLLEIFFLSLFPLSFFCLSLFISLSFLSPFPLSLSSLSPTRLGAYGVRGSAPA